MNAIYRLGLTMMVTVAALLAPASTWAQGKKPAVVVSITKLDKLLGDIGYLTRAAGTPEFGVASFGEIVFLLKKGSHEKI